MERALTGCQFIMVITLQEEYGRAWPFKMWHAEAHLENFQMLQVKLREAEGSPGQIGLQRMWMGMGYEENIKKRKL